MKITKTPKRQPEVPPEVAALCAALTDAPEAELPRVITQSPSWPWPRGDLYTWVPVLNRFDDILERVIAEHDMAPYQQKSFAPETRELLLCVLAFSRLLLENCMNRKLYASVDRLDTLLATDDIEVLEAVLYLLLRPAQQISGSSNSRHDLGISRARLASLAIAWPPREAGMELAEAAGPAPRALEAVHYSYYARRPPATPGQAEGPTEGAVSVAIRDLRGTVQEKLAEVDRSYMSPEELFELFHRVRIGLAFGSTDARRRCVTCRLLAVACYAHTVPEATASTQLFLYEPALVQHIASLISSSDPWVTATALYALEALAHYRTHLQEVLTAVSASVSHGILLQTLQDMVEQLKSGFPCSEDDASAFVDAVISLVAYITTTVSGGNMVIGAGLVPQLVTLGTLRSRDSFLVQRTATRAIGLLDSIMYGYGNAFDVFCAAHGVDAMVMRVSDEVSGAIEEASADPAPYRLAYGRVALLRIILKFFSHLMTTPGTGEGLRNLVDTPLTPSLRAIMEHSKLFGSHALAHAINITAIFVHNEPMLLPVIQEKGLSDAFLGVMRSPLDASFEVLSAATTAIGALSLNEAGIKVFSDDSVVHSLIACLGRPEYTRVLLERDNACLFGTAVDELVRHHPTFKTKVSDALIAVINTIIGDGRNFQPTGNDEVLSHFYLLPADAPPPTNETIREQDTALDATDNVGQSMRDPPQPVLAMDVLCRFLEGLFRNPAHAHAFMQANGLALLMPFYSLECLPYNFAVSASADSYVSVMRHLVEADAVNVAKALFHELAAAREQVLPHLGADQMGSSNFASLLAPSDLNTANRRFREFVTLCSRAHLLSDLYHTFSNGDPRISVPFLEVAVQNADLSLDDIGTLLRSYTWESMLFKAATANIGDDDSALSRNARGLRYVVTQTPVALRTFFGELVSLTMLRHVLKPAHFHLSCAASNACGRVLCAFLEPRAKAIRENVYAELSHNLAYVASMIFEYHLDVVMQINASVFMAFERNGGVRSLVRIVDTCRAELPESQGVLRNHIIDTLRATVAIFRALVNAKMLAGSLKDAPVPEGHKEESCHPSPAYSTAVRVRAAAYEAFSSLIGDPFINTLPTDVVRKLVETLTLLVRSEEDTDPYRVPPPPLDSIDDAFAKMVMEPIFRAIINDEPLPEVDEGLLEQMLSMGFSRLGSRCALMRARTLQSATDFLLTHHELAEVPDVTDFKPSEDLLFKKQFDQTRAKYCPELLERTIQVSEKFEEVSFEVCNLCAYLSKDSERAGECFRHVAGNLNLAPEALASHLHIAVLLLNDHNMQKKLPWDVIKPFGHDLVQLVLTQGRSGGPWVSAALLAVCNVLGFADLPIQTYAGAKEPKPLLPPEGEELRNSYGHLMEYVFWALGQEHSHMERLALFRLIAVLTRHSDCATTFAEKGGVQTLVRALNTRDLASVSGCHQLIAIALRHVAEAGAHENVMTTELYTWLQLHWRPRHSDSLGFSHDTAFAALRDPVTYFDSVQKVASVKEAHVPYHHVYLTYTSEPPAQQPSASNDAAVRVLLDELFDAASCLPEDNSPEESAPEQTNENGDKEPGPADGQSEQQDAAKKQDERKSLASPSDAGKGYMIFLMQCLTELLSSYLSCKQHFLDYTRDKKSALAFFFSDLVPAGFVHGRSKEGLRLRMAVSNWAMSVIVALGADSSVSREMKEMPQLLITTRKTMLDALCRALRETTSSHEQIETRYGRLYALADVCNRLLTVRPHGDRPKPTQEVVLHMAKTMLEKNFVTVLTTALSHVDLTLPSVKALLDSVLRPLEHLTKVAIKMGKARRNEPTEQRKSPGGEPYSDDSDESSESGSQESYSDDDIQEDAPDFYRNSALGMHTGEMEQGQYDEDMSDSQEEVEVEEYPDSEEHSEPSTDMESLDGDSTHVVEVMDEDGEDGDEEENEEDNDDNEEENEDHMEDSASESPSGEDDLDEDELELDEGAESDQPISDSVGGLLDALDNMGDSSMIEPEEEEEEGEDFYPDDLEQLEVDDDLPLDEPLSSAWRSHSRRRGLENAVPLSPYVIPEGPMGASYGIRMLSPMDDRMPGGSENPQMPRHPLLNGNEPAPQRPGPPGYNDWVRSLETLIGGGTMQFLEMLLSNGINAGTDTSIRIEFPNHGRGPQRINISNAEAAPEGRPQTQPSGPDIISESQRFTPMSTSMRWGEEMLMIFGTNGPALGERMRNHMVNALLPAFFEARRRKEAEKYEAAIERARRERELEETRRMRDQAMRELRESKERLEELELAAGNSPQRTEQDTEMQDSQQQQQQQQQSGNDTEEPRVTVQVRGLTVDLTGTGVDPTFLEALPDELREEALLSQNLGDRLAQASGASLGVVPDTISALGIAPDFLNALPSAIREELIGNADLVPSGRSTHTEEREREPEASESAQEQRAGQSTQSQPQGEAAQQSQTPSAQPATQQRAPDAPRDAIQLLDRAGIATLVRLLYFPQMSTRQSILYKVLGHLSENARSRTELLNLLLMVLAEGTENTTAVERSYAAMSSRASRGTATPTRTPRRNVPETPGSALVAPLATIGDEAPGLVASRSIEALTHLTQSNEQAALYFLREDVRVPRKAKNRERTETAEKGSAPINILLGLLEKDVILGNAQLVDSVIMLINGVTKPLDELHGDQNEEHSDQTIQADTSAGEPASQGEQGENRETAPGPSAPTEATAQPEAPQKLTRAPHIPSERLSAVVQPLTTSISSRGFQHTLSVFLHLSHIPNARDVISGALERLANAASSSLITDLDTLIESLPPASDDASSAAPPVPAAGTSRLQSAALTKLASPSSAQAVFLRSLRALEYLYVGR